MAWINAKSGTYNISTNNSAISGYVSWRQEYDIEKNISRITQEAYLHRTNIYSGDTYFTNEPITRVFYFGSEAVSTTVTDSLTIPGNSSSSGGAYVLVYGAGKEIAHNSDGTKSITLGFSMSKSDTVPVIANSFTVPKTTATVSLATIPRMTTPTLSATSITMGSTMRITLTPADSSFKHKIRYEFGSLVSQINGITSNGNAISAETFYAGGAFDFTPPTSLANEIPNATEQDATLIVYTYTSNGTHIGTAEVLIKLKVPNYTPTISNVALTGNNLLSGAYVQGKSTVDVAISASSLYGATIKDYSTTVDGKTYSGSSFTSAVLSSGSKSVAVTVTDTRGKTATYPAVGFTVYAYSAPNISEVVVTRTSNNGVEVRVTGSISPVGGKNTENTKIVIKALNKWDEMTTIELDAAKFTNAETGAIFVGTGYTNPPTEKSSICTVTITDSYNTATREALLPTVAVTMDFLDTGNGIAMGKVAEHENTLDIDWEIKTSQSAKTLSNLSFRGTNLVNSDANNTIANWSNQGNLATTFYNDASPITKPSTWGFLVNVTTGQGTTEAHQLWLEQSNGNMHHRGGNQSGFGNWRKVLDDSNCADYVIERGTSSGWEYTKWNSGKMELFATKSLSFAEGAKQADNLYRSIVQIDLKGLLSNIMSGTCCVQVNGMVPQVCRHSSTHTLAEIVIVTSRTFSAFTLTDAPIYIIGKWK